VVLQVEGSRNEGIEDEAGDRVTEVDRDVRNAFDMMRRELTQNDGFP
jgi:uncharacterized LabA/DUF88 family protein